MNKKIKLRWLLIFSFILPFLMVTVSCGGFIYYAFPETYQKPIFKKEIKENDNIKKLFYIHYVDNFWDSRIFDIGLELKDGKRILVRVQSSINNVFGIIGIDKYRIETLELDNSRKNASAFRFWWDSIWWDNISLTNGLKHWALETLLNKPNEYFCDLNNYINCYDEISEIIYKIYYEPIIPGNRDDVTRTNFEAGDTINWGNEEELEKYTGYIITNEIDRAKIYVNIIENNK